MSTLAINYRTFLTAIDSQPLLTMLGISIVMVLITVGHELGHFLPARIFTSSGKIVFFPNRDKTGLQKWLAVVACNLDDVIVQQTSKVKMLVIIAGGPIFDVLISFATFFFVAPLFTGWIAGALIAGAGFRLVFFWINLLPSPGVDGHQFLLMLRRPKNAHAVNLNK